MAETTEPPINPSVLSPAKGRVLLSSLGAALLVVGLYLVLIDFAYWLPDHYGEALLNWAGPLEGLPPRGIWAVQSVLMHILATGLGLLLIHGFYRLFFGQRLKLAFKRITEKHRSIMSKYIIIYVLVLVASEVLLSYTGLGELVQGSELESVQVGLLGQFAFFSLIVLAGPFFEEVLFRGFLYKRLRLAFSFWPAFLVSGLLFGILHFQPQAEFGYNLYGVVHASVLAYFVTRAFEATDNLWTAFIFHAIYNGWIMFINFITGAFEAAL